jgi:N-acetylneuraminic acid mutarotase
MNKKACLADQRNNKISEGNVYVVRGIGQRQEERQKKKSYEQYYHNQQNRTATTRPKTLPMGLLCPAQSGRGRTMADGALVVPCSYHVLLYTL